MTLPTTSQPSQAEALRDRLASVYDRFYAAVAPSTAIEFEEKAAPPRQVQPVPILAAQQLLRPMYGKGDPVPPSIGDHPDYIHLKDTIHTEQGAITALFVDIEGSTRLSLIHGLERTLQVKNALIRMAVDVIKSFDGHVHRILGDAVMAYFGRVGERVEVGAVDAINCAAVLRLIAMNAVAPKLEELGLRRDEFGIRTGLDYGSAEHVLWASYGQPGMSEVTATSFHVDAAAKLQQQAGRNRIMLGASLKELLDFPEELVEVKSVRRSGERKPEPYLLPNYATAKGSPHNYGKHILRADEYLRCGPVALVPGLDALPPARVTVDQYTSRNGTYLGPMVPSSDVLPKEQSLLFKIRPPQRPRIRTPSGRPWKITDAKPQRQDNLSVSDLHTRSASPATRKTFSTGRAQLIVACTISQPRC